MKRTYRQSGQTGSYVRALKKTKSVVTKPTVKALIAREINKSAELKETIVATAAINAILVAGTVLTLNGGIPQGDDTNQRNGKAIKSKYINLQYEINYQQAAGIGSGQVFLVHDKSPNGAAAAFATIFDTSAAGFTFKNTVNFRERFTIAWTETWPNCDTMSFGSVNGIGIHRKNHYFKIPDALSVTRYGSTASAVPTEGAWYFCYVGSGASIMNAVLSKYAFTDV